jgi:hypothetical protein
VVVNKSDCALRPPADEPRCLVLAVSQAPVLAVLHSLLQTQHRNSHSSCALRGFVQASKGSGRAKALLSGNTHTHTYQTAMHRVAPCPAASHWCLSFLPCLRHCIMTSTSEPMYNCIEASRHVTHCPPAGRPWSQSQRLCCAAACRQSSCRCVGVHRPGSYPACLQRQQQQQHQHNGRQRTVSPTVRCARTVEALAVLRQIRHDKLAYIMLAGTFPS